VTWELSTRASVRSREIADRHYNRQKPGTRQFVPTGSCLVLHADRALWVTSWPLAEWVRHQWGGAWINSTFRKEGAGIASEMIREAVAHTRSHYGDPPALGMVTFIDRSKVRPTMVRGVPVWGWTYLKAGFRLAGETKVNKLLAFQLLPEDMPPGAPIPGSTSRAVGKLNDGISQ
jgi:hypothetical protein